MYSRHLVVPESSEVCSHPFSTCVPSPHCLRSQALLPVSTSPHHRFRPALALLDTASNPFIALLLRLVGSRCVAHIDFWTTLQASCSSGTLASSLTEFSLSLCRVIFSFVLQLTIHHFCNTPATFPFHRPYTYPQYDIKPE